MRKRSRYRPKPVMTWMPTSDQMNIAIMTYLFDDKLARGEFDDIDGNTLAFLLNVARKLANDANNQEQIERADKAMEAFLGIRQRRERTGKWGANGEELVSMREHLPPLADYMTSQPVHRLQAARSYVLKVNRRMHEEGALFADVEVDGSLVNVRRAA